MLRDPAGQDGADVQRRADRRRVGLEAAVAEHEAARNDADGAELRQAVDDALGDAVGQVVELRAGGVDERQHGERLAARPRRAGHAHRGTGEQRAKRPAHVLRRREPPPGIALHGACDHRAQLLRGQRVEAREIRRRVVQQPRNDLLRRRAGEELCACEHLVEQAAEREHVGAAVDALAGDLLGRHVSERAEHDSLRRPRDGRPIGPGDVEPLQREAEVENLDVAVAGQEDVLGLEIPVHDPLGVRGRQAVGDGGGDVDGFAPRQRSLRDPLAQVAAFEQLHHGERDAVGDGKLVDRQNAGMAQRGDRPRFGLEARAHGRIGGDVRRHHLQCHFPAEPGISCPIDDAHAAGAYCRLDLVMGKAGSRGQHHRQACGIEPARRRSVSRGAVQVGRYELCGRPSSRKRRNMN